MRIAPWEIVPFCTPRAARSGRAMASPAGPSARKPRVGLARLKAWLAKPWVASAFFIAFTALGIVAMVVPSELIADAKDGQPNLQTTFSTLVSCAWACAVWCAACAAKREGAAEDLVYHRCPLAPSCHESVDARAQHSAGEAPVVQIAQMVSQGEPKCCSIRDC